MTQRVDRPELINKLITQLRAMKSQRTQIETLEGMLQTLCGCIHNQVYFEAVFKDLERQVEEAIDQENDPDLQKFYCLLYVPSNGERAIVECAILEALDWQDAYDRAVLSAEQRSFHVNIEVKHIDELPQIVMAEDGYKFGKLEDGRYSDGDITIFLDGIPGWKAVEEGQKK